MSILGAISKTGSGLPSGQNNELRVRGYITAFKRPLSVKIIITMKVATGEM